MSPRITLTVVAGSQTGTEYVFERQAVLMIGRGRDCDLRVPENEMHLTISRHHCLLFVDPPDVAVRDCGSRNGTYLNGVRLGGRAAAAVVGSPGPEWPLRDGDLLQIGDLAFRVGVEASVEVETDAGALMLSI